MTAAEPWQALLAARSVTEDACECENAQRAWYVGRDEHLHCEQCDGRHPANPLNQKEA